MFYPPPKKKKNLKILNSNVEMNATHELEPHKFKKTKQLSLHS